MRARRTTSLPILLTGLALVHGAACGDDAGAEDAADRDALQQPDLEVEADVALDTAPDTAPETGPDDVSDDTAPPDGADAAIDVADDSDAAADAGAELPPPPHHDDPFDRGVVTVRLSLDDTARALLASDPRSQVPAACQLDAEPAHPCHVELAGDERTFRALDGKASFGVRFDDGAYGLAGLELDAQLDEPSQLRTLVGHLLFRRLGLPAPRATLARVVVNGEDFGVYAAVESLDSPDFIAAAVGSEAAVDGAVFVADHSVDFWPWLVPELALITGDEARRAPIATLADALEDFRIARLDGKPYPLADAVADQIDMPLFLDTMAAEVWLGHRAGYPRGTRDYALHVAASGRLTFLPRRLGAGLDPDDQADPWWSGGRLLRHCFEDAACRPDWGSALDRLVTRVASANFLAEVSAMRFLVNAELASDPRRESSLDDIAAAQEVLLITLAGRSGWVAENLACTEPADVDHDGDGASVCIDDCDDDHADVHPGAPEQCNLRDDDCDGLLDDHASCPECVEVPDPIHGDGARWALCYAPRSWVAARDACRSQGGELVRVPDLETHDALRRAALGLQWNNWWIGLSDLEVEGTFAWSDGTPFTPSSFAAWSGGEPNDWGGNEDCAHLVPWAGGLWNDLACDREIPYVCALPAPP